MKTHNQLIYHCERCGKLAYREPEDAPPACCGAPMTHAAEITVSADGGFEPTGDAHVDDEGAARTPRTPK